MTNCLYAKPTSFDFCDLQGARKVLFPTPKSTSLLFVQASPNNLVVSFFDILALQHFRKEIHLETIANPTNKEQQNANFVHPDSYTNIDPEHILRLSGNTNLVQPSTSVQQRNTLMNKAICLMVFGLPISFLQAGWKEGSEACKK